MCATDGDRVFVADFSSEHTGLAKTKMMGVERHAAADDAGLAGHGFGMLLVAQANGLADDPAAAWADFLRDFRKRGSAAGATLTASIGVSCAGSSASASTLALKLDELRIGGSSAGSCRAVAGEPSLVGGRKANEFGNQTIAQRGGLFGRQNGPRGADEFWLAGATRRHLGNECCDTSTPPICLFMSTASVSASQIRAARHLANLRKPTLRRPPVCPPPTIRRESEREVSVFEEHAA